MINIQNLLRTLQKFNFIKKNPRKNFNKEFKVDINYFKSNLLEDMNSLKELSRRSVGFVIQKFQIENCIKSLSNQEIQEFAATSIL